MWKSGSGRPGVDPGRRRAALLAPLGGAAALCLVGCGTTDVAVNEAIDQYAAVATSGSGLVAGDSAAARAGVERWKVLLGEFSEENLKGKVAGVYSDGAFFNDTLKTLEGAEAIEAYLLETAELLHYGTVDFEDVAVSGKDVYVRWRMVYRSKVLSKDRDIVTIGMTHLQFDREGKVVMHQDFWDSARGVFEHVPVVGYGIRVVKGRL